jgi:periplasmic protein TonB
MSMPYVLEAPASSRPSRAGPIAVTVVAHVVVIAALATGLKIQRMNAPPAAIEMVNVPVEVMKPEPVVQEPVDAEIASKLDLPDAPLIPVAPDVPDIAPLADAISVTTTQEPGIAGPVSKSLAELQLTRKVDPAYPPASRRADEEGTVLVKLIVAANGRVVDARVERSSGFPRLDQAALQAVRNWQFSSAGGNERASVSVPIKFELHR